MASLAPFDIADHLDNEEVIAEYLPVALEDPDPAMFLAIINQVPGTSAAAVPEAPGRIRRCLSRPVHSHGARGNGLERLGPRFREMYNVP
jgi:DNA-binding phage protein